MDKENVSCVTASLNNTASDSTQHVSSSLTCLAPSPSPSPPASSVTSRRVCFTDSAIKRKLGKSPGKPLVPHTDVSAAYPLEDSAAGPDIMTASIDNDDIDHATLRASSAATASSDAAKDDSLDSVQDTSMTSSDAAAGCSCDSSNENAVVSLESNVDIDPSARVPEIEGPLSNSNAAAGPVLEDVFELGDRLIAVDLLDATISSPSKPSVAATGATAAPSPAAAAASAAAAVVAFATDTDGENDVYRLDNELLAELDTMMMSTTTMSVSSPSSHSKPVRHGLQGESGRSGGGDHAGGDDEVFDKVRNVEGDVDAAALLHLHASGQSQSIEERRRRRSVRVSMDPLNASRESIDINLVLRQTLAVMGGGRRPSFADSVRTSSSSSPSRPASRDSYDQSPSAGSTAGGFRPRDYRRCSGTDPSRGSFSQRPNRRSGPPLPVVSASSSSSLSSSSTSSSSLHAPEPFPVHLVSSTIPTHLEAVLGRCLANLGFKRIYLASARLLCANVPIWTHQRPYSDERVAAIADAKDIVCPSDPGGRFEGVQSDPAPTFIGPIAVYVLTDGIRIDLGIFDGQHRVKAMQEILNRREARLRGRLGLGSHVPLSKAVEAQADFAVLLEVWPVRSYHEVAELYKEVNKAEPVQEIDLHLPFASTHAFGAPVAHLASSSSTTLSSSMTASSSLPGSTSGSSTAGDGGHGDIRHGMDSRRVKEIINEATTSLYIKYKSMFKPSSRCIAPHLNLEVFRNKLFVVQVCDALNVDSSERLVQIIEEVLSCTARMLVS